MEISMQGYLTKVKKTGVKRLSVRYGSKRRWFQLHGHELRYYDSEENANTRKHESLCGFIDIFDIQSVRNISISTPNTFQIMTRRKGSLSLTADSEDGRNKWIECLQLAMRLKRSTISVSEILKGSVSDENCGNSSDDEFWDQESPNISTASSNTFDINRDARTENDDVEDDDVFKENNKEISNSSHPTIDVVERDIKHSSLTGPVEDEKNSNINASEGKLRESGYETTDFSDDIDNRTDLKTIKNEEENEHVKHANEPHEELQDVRQERSVDMLRDLLSHTTVSTFGDEDSEEYRSNENEMKENVDGQGMSAMDQLRSLLDK